MAETITLFYLLIIYFLFYLFKKKQTVNIYELNKPKPKESQCIFTNSNLHGTPTLRMRNSTVIIPVLVSETDILLYLK